MRKFFLLILLLACLGVDAQVYRQIGFGTDVPTSTLYAPIYRFSATSTTRMASSNMVFTAAEMTAAGFTAGEPILALRFNKRNDASSTAPFIFNMYMKNSSVVPPLATTTRWDSILSGHTEVYNNPAFTLRSDTDWYEFPLTTPFIYTGGSLEIAFLVDYGSSPANVINNAISWQYTDGFATSIIGSTATNPTTLNGSSTIYKQRPNIQFATPVSGTDLNASSLASSTITTSGSSYSPELNIVNFGTTAITAADLHYQVNGGAVVTQAWTGNLLSGAGASVAFTQGYTVPAGANHELKLWVSNINGAGPDNNTSNDTLVKTLLHTLVGDYTVGNGGDITSLAHARAQIAAAGLSGPTRLLLLSGTHTGNVEFNSIPGSSATNTLTITSNAGNRDSVELVRDGLTGNTLSMVGVSNVIISNISIKNTNGTPTGTSACLNMSNVDNIVVDNCLIESVDGSVSTSTTANRAIYGTKPINNLRVNNSTIIGGYYGIYITGSTSGTAAYNQNPIIRGNTVRSQHYYGIYLVETSGARIDSNTILDPSPTNASYEGIFLSRCLDAEISRNQLLHYIGPYGIEVSNANSAKIYNNVIAGESRTGITRSIYVVGSTTDGIDTVDIINNSIYLRHASTATTVAGNVHITGGSSTAPAFHQLRLLNNSIVSESLPGSTSSTHPALYMVGDHHLNVVNSNYNNIHFINSSGHPLVRIASTPYAGLSDFQTATNSDLNSRSADPAYAGLTDLTPAPTGALNDGGTPVSYVTTDILGNARDVNNPEIGAYEIQMISRDLAISAFVNPGISVNASTSEQVSVQLSNNGSAIVTAASLSYQFNNGTVVTETFSGSIPFLQNQNFTFSTPITIPASGNPVLRVWVNSVNGQTDLNNSNDTLAQTLCMVIPAGNYTLGGSNPSFASVQEFVDRLNCGGIAGTVSVNFEPGTYDFNATIINFPNTTGSTLIFGSNGNPGDVILTNNGSGATFTLNGATNISFSGLSFKHLVTPATGFRMIEANGTNNVTIVNCDFQGFNVDSTTSSQNLGVYFTGCSNSTIANNTFRDLYYGLYANGSSPSYGTNNVYQGNVFSRIYHTSIYLQSEDGVLISQNIHNGVIGESVSTGGYGIYLSRGQNITIEGNRLYNLSGNYGIFMSSMNGDSLAPNRIYNNAISANFSGTARRAISVTGSTTDGLDYLEIDHNSIEVISNHTSNTVQGTIYFTGGSTTTPAFNGVKFRNNSVKTVMAGTSTAFVNLYFSNESISGIYAASNNTWYYDNQLSPTVRIGTTAYQALADWQSFSGTDVNSTAFDPQYISATDLSTLPTSPNVGSGIPLAHVTTDLLGVTRSTTAPDRGAFENQNLDYNLFAFAFDRPGTRVLGGVTDTVSAYIMNLGNQTITSFTGNYQLGSGPVVTQNFTVNLPFTDTAYIVFNTPVTMPLNGSAQLKIWVTSPNGQADEDFTNDTVTVDLCVGLSTGTYTLGSPTSDFPTLADFNNALICGGLVNGPVTISIDFPQNLFEGQFVIPPYPGASATNSLHFVGNGDTIRHTPSATTNTPAILLAGANHVTVADFVVDMTHVDGANTMGILLTDNASNNRITRNRVLMDTVVTTSTLAGIVSSGGPNSVSSTTEANYNLIDSNYIRGAYYAIRLNGSSTNPTIGNRVIGNQIEDFYIYGVYFLQASMSEVSGNNITRPGRAAISTFYGVYLGSGTNGTHVTKNRIYNPKGIGTSTSFTFYGISSSSADADPTTPNVIANNAIYDVSGTTGTSYGIYNSSSNSNHYFHNTIILNDPNSASGTTYGFYTITEAFDVQLKNNVIMVERAGSGVAYAMYQSTATTQLETNFNSLWCAKPAGSTGLAHIGYRTSARTTLADWQAAGSTGGTAYDSNSVNANPDFLNLASWDLTPSNVFLNESGTNLQTIVPDDINGVLRGTSPDLGAVEFTPTGSDAALTAVKVIQSGSDIGSGTVCLASLNGLLAVDVVNAGALDITSFTVNYQLNGGTVVTETVNTTIASAQTYTHTFAAPVTLLTGANNIQAWVDIANDFITVNDSAQLNLSVGLNSILTLPFTENFDGGSLPTSLCFISGSSAKAEVLAAHNNIQLNIAGSHSLVLTGSSAGTGWATANNTNVFSLNPEFQNYVNMYVDASSASRLRMRFKLLQLYRAANSTAFRLLVNGQPVAPVGYPTADLIAAGATSNTDTLSLEYDLDSFVGDTIQLVMQSAVRYDYSGSPLSANIVDDLLIEIPQDARFDSVTVAVSGCTPTARTIAAEITSVPSISSVNLKYTVNNGAVQTVPMTLGTQYYTGTIPAATSGNDSIRYFVETNSSTGVVSNSATFVYADDYLVINLGPDVTINAGDSTTLVATTSGGSAGGQGSLIFSEFMYYKGGGTGRQASFPAYLPNGSGDDDYIELTNITRSPVSLAGMRIRSVVAAATYDITLPAGAVLGPGQVAVIMPGTGANNIANNVYYMGGPDNNEWLSSTNPAGIVLYDTDGTTVIDAVRYNANDFPASFNVPASEWVGTLNGSASYVGFFRISQIDNNSANDWSYNTADTLSSIGTLNFNYTLINNDTVGWSTLAGVYLGRASSLVVRPTVTTTYVASYGDANCIKRDTITVFVNQPVANDVSVSRIVTPAPGSVNNNATTISVIVKNYGTQAASGFDVSYRVTPSGAVGTNTITSNIAAGDSLLVTFTQAWTPTSGGNFTICAFTLLNGDAVSANDTSCVAVSSTVSVEDLARISSRLYPNPANDVLNIEFGEAVSGSLSIHDALGKVVKTIQLEQGTQSMDIDISALSAGMYSYKLQTQGKLAQGKFVVSR